MCEADPNAQDEVGETPLFEALEGLRVFCVAEACRSVLWICRLACPCGGAKQNG